jgi:3-isopropylmalate dehydrogenase
MVPSASLGAAEGDRFFGLYEPAGGTAPDIAGKDLANPIAQILSAALMVQYSFKLRDAANAILQAIGKAIADGYRTGDIFNPADSATKKVGTRAMGDAVAAAI